MLHFVGHCHKLDLERLKESLKQVNVLCLHKFSHYEKLCSEQLDYPTIRASKQLIYNCITTIPWKYNKLINKMPHQKIKELYYSCKLVARCIFIEYNVCIVYLIVVNHV
jgi:hypothetical protein